MLFFYSCHFIDLVSFSIHGILALFLKNIVNVQHGLICLMWLKFNDICIQTQEVLAQLRLLSDLFVMIYSRQSSFSIFEI